MKLSFVIPALNEEKNIFHVISQFHALKGLYDYEVIISDGGSTDQTRKVAREHGAKVFLPHPGDPKTIANARNVGASHAKGDILVFCDADTRIDDIRYFVKTITKAFEDPKLIGGNPSIKVFREERLFKDVLFQKFYSFLIRMSYFFQTPISSGQCQFARKSAFDSIGGYDRNRVHAEDTDMMGRMAKIGKVKYFPRLTILESPRRYRSTGYLKLMAIGLYSFVMFSILRRNVLSEWKRVG